MPTPLFVSSFDSASPFAVWAQADTPHILVAGRHGNGCSITGQVMRAALPPPPIPNGPAQLAFAGAGILDGTANSTLPILTIIGGIGNEGPTLTLRRIGDGRAQVVFTSGIVGTQNLGLLNTVINQNEWFFLEMGSSLTVTDTDNGDGTHTICQSYSCTVQRDNVQVLSNGGGGCQTYPTGVNPPFALFYDSASMGQVIDFDDVYVSTTAFLGDGTAQSDDATFTINTVNPTVTQALLELGTEGLPDKTQLIATQVLIEVAIGTAISGLTFPAGVGASFAFSGTSGVIPGSHTTCVQSVGGGGILTDIPYIVRSYTFSSERFPPDIIYMTPWSDLGYVFDKISRNIVLDIDTGGFPCVVGLQADGISQQTFTVTTTSHDRDRVLATNSNLEGRLWRLVFTPAADPNAKAQVFAAGLDYVADVNSVNYLDTYWQDFGWTGWSAIKQSWIFYQGGPISIKFLTDGDANFYTTTLPVTTTRLLSRFYLPAVNAGVLNKSKLHRLQVSGVGGADFRLYAGSLLEVIPFGKDQRLSFNLVNVNAEMQLKVAQMMTGAWSLGA